MIETNIEEKIQTAVKKENNPLKAIRLNCLECVGTPTEIKLCVSESCNLYPYRFGKNPFRKPVSEARRVMLREQVKKYGFGKK